MASMKLTNPLRFFGFFGLFLVFMFLAVKSCSDRRSKMEFVAAEDVTEITDVSREKENSKELSEFIKGIKKDIKKKDEITGDLFIKDIEKLEDKNINKETIKKFTGKTIRIKKKVKKNIFKKSPSFKKERTRNWKEFRVLVKASGNKINSFSKLKLQKNLKILNSIGRGRIIIYGGYFPGEVKSKGFIRAANIKNELISLGLNSSISIFTLPYFRNNKDFIGEVRFSK